MIKVINPIDVFLNRFTCRLLIQNKTSYARMVSKLSSPEKGTQVY